MTPNLVGNAGFASLRIQGAQFEDIERVFLVMPDGQRQAALVVTTVSASEIRALFNVRGVQHGSYTLGVRKRSGEEVTLNDAVQIVETPVLEPPLAIRVSGPDAVRPGANALYYVTVYNGGNNDAVVVPVLVRVPAGTPWAIPELRRPSPEAADLPADYEPGDGWRYILVIVPVVPAQDSETFRLILTAPTQGQASNDSYLGASRFLTRCCLRTCPMPLHTPVK